MGSLTAGVTMGSSSRGMGLPAGARSPLCSLWAPRSLDRAPLAQPCQMFQPKGGQPDVSEGPRCRLFASPQDTGATCACPGGWLSRSSQALLLILETALLLLVIVS